jgi:hypothetical protein
MSEDLIYLADLRSIRAAVLNGLPVPAAAEARLTALGYDVAKIEQRLLNQKVNDTPSFERT